MTEPQARQHGDHPEGGDDIRFREMTLEHDLSASPPEVWSAWTDPQEFAQWWHGPGFITTGVTWELRPNGRFLATQTSSDTGMQIEFAGLVREVDPGRRLRFDLSDSPDPHQPGRTEMTVALSDNGTGGTRQQFHQSGTVDREHFEGLEAGNRAFMAQLAEMLSTRT